MPNFQQVKSGDSFLPQANEWNAMLDAAIAHRQGGGSGSVASVVPSPASFRVRNNENVTLERFHAVMLGAPAVPPADDYEDEFKNRPVMNVTRPSGSKANWAVTQTDLPRDGIGSAVYVGLTVCRIKVEKAGDTHVEIDPNASDKTIPKSGTQGTARIVWKPTGTGEKWALICLGDQIPEFFRVAVTTDGGIAGGGSAGSCTYTYTLKLPNAPSDASPLATGRTPERGRMSKVKYNAATYGIAYRDANDQVQLFDANEQPQTEEVVFQSGGGTPTYRMTSEALEVQYSRAVQSTIGVLYKIPGSLPDNYDPANEPWHVVFPITTECPNEEGPP